MGDIINDVWIDIRNKFLACLFRGEWLDTGEKMLGAEQKQTAIDTAAA